MKTCTKCKQTLSIENFAFKNKSLGKRSSQCNDCRREGNRNSFYNNHQKNLDRIKEYKKNNKLWFTEFKKTLSCCVCGENDPCALDFHHVDEKEKDFTLSKYSESSIERLKKEINKCACLCANCHRKVHAGKINPPLVKLDIT